MSNNYQHTKVIFTIGPATTQQKILEQVINAGANICRFNMAHASHDWARETMQLVRETAAKFNKTVVFMIDIKGPEIRTGDVDKPKNLDIGDVIDFVTILEDYNQNDGIFSVTVNYPGLAEDVEVGDKVLVDSGLIQFEVIKKGDGFLRIKALTPGVLTNRRHINLPGVTVNLPSITEKDKRDIALGIENDVAFFALSFVRHPEDIRNLRRYLSEKGSSARIIAKIEDQSAVSHLDDIIQASDGLMVARGDLGIECPYEELPIIQRRSVQACIKFCKPVIIATHMLESMITNPVPTRAEVSDIANAVYERADAVMLSGETTTGKYPVECITVMNRIAGQMERMGKAVAIPELELLTPKEKLLKAALNLAKDLESGSIIAFTRNGYLPQILSSMRPTGTPIYAFTDDKMLYRQLLLLWGVKPYFIAFQEDPTETIKIALDVLKADDSIHQSEWHVIITNIFCGENSINSIQLRQV